MILAISIYVIGYVLSVILGRKYLKMGNERNLRMGDLWVSLFLSIASWLSVIVLIILLAVDSPDKKKPAPKWFR